VTLHSGEVREAAIVTYDATHDKKGTTSVAVFVGTGLGRVRELIAKPLVQRTGLLLPHGNLDKRGKGEGRPIAKETLNDILLDAEKDAGIEHVTHRSYHRMKRRFTGMSKRMREMPPSNRTPAKPCWAAPTIPRTTYLPTRYSRASWTRRGGGVKPRPVLRGWRFRFVVVSVGVDAVEYRQAQLAQRDVRSPRHRVGDG
jgi:hypothetical protein